jgi:hypothetical protein
MRAANLEISRNHLLFFETELISPRSLDSLFGLKSGKSSGELLFGDDSKPDCREQLEQKGLIL